MYKNKYNGRNNICGIGIRHLRLNATPKMSQRALADQMQLHGIDLDKNAIQRIESGQRFIIDTELIAFADVFNVSVDYFFSISDSHQSNYHHL